MGSKIERYRARLKILDNWEPFLRQESRLPGPRANLELATAVSLEGDAALFARFLMLDPKQAPENTPEVFLAVCGVLGQGTLLAGGDKEALERLNKAASDPRWRVREGVVLALQAFGRKDLPGLLVAMITWSNGNRYEQRAAAAALCEPNFLVEPAMAESVLSLLDRITATLVGAPDGSESAFKTLRKSLGYCWSVVLCAFPAGRPRFERWFSTPDRNVRWMIKENLRKKRLARLDPFWLEQARARMGMG